VNGDTPQPAPRTVPSGVSATIHVDTPQDGGVGERFAFSFWEDASTLASRQLTLASGATYTATFGRQLQLTVIAGAGGSVNAASGWYAVGAAVPLVATPSPGYAFQSWTNTGSVPANPNQASTSVTLTAVSTVTANFAAIVTGGTTVEFLTEPANLNLKIDGTTRTTPYSHVVPAGGYVKVEAAVQTIDTNTFHWQSWSDQTGDNPRDFYPTATSPATTRLVARFSQSSLPDFSLVPASGTVTAGGTLSFTAYKPTLPGQQPTAAAVSFELVSITGDLPSGSISCSGVCSSGSTNYIPSSPFPVENRILHLKATLLEDTRVVRYARISLGSGQNINNGNPRIDLLPCGELPSCGRFAIFSAPWTNGSGWRNIGNIKLAVVTPPLDASTSAPILEGCYLDYDPATRRMTVTDGGGQYGWPSQGEVGPGKGWIGNRHCIVDLGAFNPSTLEPILFT
jgi:hypothetical protein